MAKALRITGLFIFIQVLLYGQDLKYYRYDKDLLSKEFHQGRRAAFRAAMPEKTAAIFFAAPLRNRSNDNDYDYHQDPDFYYLTGFTEPGAVLLIFQEPTKILDRETKEILFVPEREPDKEQWTGRRAGKEGAMELLGIQDIATSADFLVLSLDYKSFVKVFYSLPRGLSDDRTEPTDVFDLVEAFKKQAGFPPDNGDSRQMHSILAALREVKQPEEVALLRKAIDISCDGHIEMMRATKPGMSEFEVEAVGEYVFARGGAEAVGYPSICGGGENSTVLHYSTNRKTLAEGDLILLDMGAEYHGYTGDVTRTLPVSGKFTTEQALLYALVLKAQEAGIQACRPGQAFTAPHQAAVEVLKRGLLELEIIRQDSEYRRYFMHGTSHYLGLDVHDIGTWGKLQNGTVLTVEPGLYIPEGSPCDPKWWNIGIRIEDDILVTAEGCENLSKKAPKSIEDVQKMMKEEPVFVK